MVDITAPVSASVGSKHGSRAGPEHVSASHIHCDIFRLKDVEAAWLPITESIPPLSCVGQADHTDHTERLYAREWGILT